MVFSRVFAIVVLACVFAQAQIPASPGLTKESTASVKELIKKKMAKDRIPGLSIAIVINGELAWSSGFGLADIENGVAARASTVYRTASIGKPLTATAVMQLAERGLLDIEAPVQIYCPAFPEKRWPLTTRHLLGHTSGIRHYGGPRNDAELFNTIHYTSVIEALDIFKNDSLLFMPGSGHQYSTFGYNVLGCVVEGSSGKDFLAYMRIHIFEPAGMSNTRDDDPGAIIPERSRGYYITEDGNLVNSRAVDMSSKIPAGGFVTTAPDLARFAISVMNHRLITRQTLELMITPVRLNNGEIVPYGLGWGLFPGETWYDHREAFHGGATPQVSGMLYLLPDARFAVALLTNLENVPERTALAAEIARIVLDLGNESK